MARHRRAEEEDTLPFAQERRQESRHPRRQTDGPARQQKPRPRGPSEVQAVAPVKTRENRHGQLGAAKNSVDVF